MSEGLTLEKIRKAAEILSANEVPTEGRYMMLLRQIRFPKTKNRRIRRKWASRPENYRYEGLLIGGKLHRQEAMKNQKLFWNEKARAK